MREYPGSKATAASVKIATKLAAYPWRLAPQQVSAVVVATAVVVVVLLLLLGMRRCSSCRGELTWRPRAGQGGPGC